MKRFHVLAGVPAMAAMVLTLAAGCLPPGSGKKQPAVETPAPVAVKAPPASAACMDLVLPTAETGTAVTAKHFVTNWMLLGPFQFKESDFGGDQQQASIDKEFVANEGALDGTQKPPAGAAWKSMQFTSTDPAGMVDLDPVYDGLEHVAAYAVAWLDCPQDLPNAKLYVGSDDYLKVWINGRLVHTYKKERRAGEADQDIVSGIALQKGPNRIVIKCVDVVLGWNFFFRLTDAQGRPILVKPRQ
jgi:hypothetical protein